MLSDFGKELLLNVSKNVFVSIRFPSSFFYVFFFFFFFFLFFFFYFETFASCYSLMF